MSKLHLLSVPVVDAYQIAPNVFLAENGGSQAILERFQFDEAYLQVNFIHSIFGYFW